nr:MAG TPA: hypothetical protein [Caudoviricetes sp.]
MIYWANYLVLVFYSPKQVILKTEYIAKVIYHWAI